MSCVVGFSVLMSILGILANIFHRKRKATRKLKTSENDSDLQVLTTVKKRFPREK